MRKKRHPPPTKEEYDKLTPAQKLVLLTTEERKKAFVDALREKFTIHAACKVAEIARRTYYDWREADENFAAACDSALQDAVDNLEENMYQKALAGKDTIATIFMLKGNRPDKYKERGAIEHTGKDGGPIEVNSARNILASALGGTTGKDSKPTKERDR